MLQVTKWLQWAAGPETMPQVPKVAAGTGSQEQPVPGRDSAVPQVAIVGHKGQGAVWWVRDFDGAANPQGETDGWACQETALHVSEGGWSQVGNHVVGERQRHE